MKFICSILFALLVSCSANAQSDVEALVQFGEFKGYGVHDATVEQILEHPRLRCLKKKCRVISFDIYGIAPGKEYIGPYNSEADTLTASQQRYIRSLERDSKLWICNIHLRYADGTEQVIGTKDTQFSICFFNVQ